ncbi:MAG: hypothetical protein PV340_01465 [Wolbachia sp.]|nr:hypothetical protein [Wolbachia sp.]MDD9335826.1 hypothetical protein [Wolbachia sp.]
MEITTFSIGKKFTSVTLPTMYISFPAALFGEPGFLHKLFKELKFLGAVSRSYISGVSMQLSKIGSAANNCKLHISDYSSFFLLLKI